jgi:hypothetical protein
MSDSHTARLSENIVQRIAAEEAARMQIRQTLENSDKTKPPTSKFWQFLNSPLGIFVLTTIFVSGIGGVFTLWQQHFNEMQANKRQALRLLAEFDFRLNEIEFRSAHIAELKDPTARGQETMYIWRAARGNVDFQPALPEYHNVHWAGIIIQLAGLGASQGSAEAIAATRQLENGATVPVGNGFGVFPPGILEKETKALQQYNDAAWRTIDPGHPPGSRPF